MSTPVMGVQNETTEDFSPLALICSLSLRFQLAEKHGGTCSGTPVEGNDNREKGNEEKLSLPVVRLSDWKPIMVT